MTNIFTFGLKTTTAPSLFCFRNYIKTKTFCALFPEKYYSILNSVHLQFCFWSKRRNLLLTTYFSNAKNRLIFSHFDIKLGNFSAIFLVAENLSSHDGNKYIASIFSRYAKGLVSVWQSATLLPRGRRVEEPVSPVRQSSSGGATKGTKIGRNAGSLEQHKIIIS